MIIKTQEELDGIKLAGKLFGEIRDRMIAATKPGMTTAELDQIAADFFEETGAISAPKNDFGFPGYSCISVNEEVAHGIPGNRVIEFGDMVNIDVSGSYNGYYVDTGRSIIVGTGSQQAEQLLRDSQLIFDEAVKLFIPGEKLHLVGKKVHELARAKGYEVLENLTGHGVGHSLRDLPENVYNIDSYWDQQVIKEGHVLAFEPFISTKGTVADEKNDDGWTLTAGPDSLVCQIEHTVIVTSNGPLIVT